MLAQSWKCKQLETKQFFSRKGTLRIMWSNLLFTHSDTVVQDSQGTHHPRCHVTHSVALFRSRPRANLTTQSPRTSLSRIYHTLWVFVSLFCTLKNIYIYIIYMHSLSFSPRTNIVFLSFVYCHISRDCLIMDAQ